MITVDDDVTIDEVLEQMPASDRLLFNYDLLAYGNAFARETDDGFEYCWVTDVLKECEPSDGPTATIIRDREDLPGGDCRIELTSDKVP